MKKNKMWFLLAVGLLAVSLPLLPFAETSAGVVRIGFIGPITGSNSAEGAAARNAFQMTVDEANASGRFPFAIETIIVDDQSTEGVAVAGVQMIVGDRLTVAAAGFWNSGPALASIPVFKDAEIPLLVWGAIHPNITNAYNVPWITRSAPIARQQNTPLAAFVLDELGYTDWFVVSDVGSYGSANFYSFIDLLNERGITPLGSERVQEDTTDLSAIVHRIRASGATAVYCGSTVGIGAQLKRQLHEAGVDVLFTGISGMKSDDFLIIGAAAAEGALITNPGVILADSEAGRRFIEAYNAGGFAEPIGAYTPHAYDAAMIILNALESLGANPTPEAMARAILNSETTGVLGTTTFNEIGQTTNVNILFNVIQDGEWFSYWASEYYTGERCLGGHGKACDGRRR